MACLAFLRNEFFDLQIPAIAAGHRKSTVTLAPLRLFLMSVWLWGALGSFGSVWGDFGRVWEVCESVLGGFGTVLGASGSVLGGFGSVWEVFDRPFNRPTVRSTDRPSERPSPTDRAVHQTDRIYKKKLPINRLWRPNISSSSSLREFLGKLSPAVGDCVAVRGLGVSRFRTCRTCRTCGTCVSDSMDTSRE